MHAKDQLREKDIKTFCLSHVWLMLVLCFLAVVICIRPDFFDINNLPSILEQASTRGILALGAAGILITVGPDLSAGRILGTCAALTGSLVQSTTYASRMWPNLPELPWIVPLLVSVIVAVLFCALNGFGVTTLKLQSYIMTYGTQLIAYGVTCIYLDSGPGGAQALSAFNSSFKDLVNGGIPITEEIQIPYLIFYFAAAAIVMWFVWNKTTLGKNMRAVGADRMAAAAAGVRVNKTIMGAFLTAGVLYGVAAFLETGRIGPIYAIGLNYDIDVLSACLIGGVSLSGGVGTISGVILGVLLLQAVNYSLAFLSVNPYLHVIIKGLLLILAEAIDVRRYLHRKQEAKNTEQQKG